MGRQLWSHGSGRSERSHQLARTGDQGLSLATGGGIDALNPASGAQSIPNGGPAGDEGTHSEEEGFAMEDEDSDGELNTWELPEGVSSRLPREQAADLFNEDWDLELKADQGNPYDADDIQGCISQEVKPWVCCAPQGDMIYDPSWHHPPPLIPHYSKMVFETGQFDDAED
ncbi:Cooperator of PRMT5 [Myotis davidii]|uniref:Cooperator of PRMT5 n=1 Tax=Myotis davidii TaxID=225400 RepID=L5LVG4_MYODS|nr:Cooperator of PRMT5 [Myotis davidii]